MVALPTHVLLRLKKSAVRDFQPLLAILAIGGQAQQAVVGLPLMLGLFSISWLDSGVEPWNQASIELQSEVEFFPIPQSFWVAASDAPLLDGQPWLIAATNIDSGLPAAPPSILRDRYPSFNSDRLDQQLQLYAQYLQVFGVPDVLIVGSSRSLQGIDPTVVQATLEARGIAGVTVYNFGINGATAQVVDLLVREILAPEQLPKLLIWADGLRALNEGRADSTFEGIVDSAAYRQIQSGLRPIRTLEPERSLPSPPTEVCVNPIWMALGSDVSTRHTLALNGNWPLRSLNKTLTDLSYQHPCSNDAKASHEMALFDADLTALLQLQPVADLAITGFRSVATQFDPATYYQQFPFVPGAYDADYVPFRLNGAQTQATLRLAAYAQQQQIPLVYVNLPLTERYLDATRMQYEQQYQQHMQQLAAQANFGWINLLGRWSNQPNYFADPSHLNQRGAQAVAEAIATAPQIPWPLLQSDSE